VQVPFYLYFYSEETGSTFLSAGTHLPDYMMSHDIMTEDHIQIFTVVMTLCYKSVLCYSILHESFWYNVRQKYDYGLNKTVFHHQSGFINCMISGQDKSYTRMTTIYPGESSLVSQEESAPEGDPGCVGKME